MSTRTLQKLNKIQAMNLADNLNALLLKRNIDYRDLAEALGVPPMSIWRLVSKDMIDPRLSTLNDIANFFNVTIDSLIGRKLSLDNLDEQTKPNFIPVLDWTTAANIDQDTVNFDNWTKWQPIPKKENFDLSSKSFAIESTPSMNPRYPQGTIIIIDPDLKPLDGDIVLVKINETNELTLRDLIIDPPDWKLQSIVNSSQAFQYDSSLHKILGVVVLNMLYSVRF